MGSLNHFPPNPLPTHLGIVVARFKESLEPWAPYAANTYLYSKFPVPQANDSVAHSSFREYVELENLGREGKTYLHHIVTKYEALDDITVFSQAAPFDILSPVTTTVSEIVETALKTPEDDVTIFNPALLHDIADWDKINWTSPTESIWVTGSEIASMTPSKFTPAEFWSKVLHEPHPPAIRALHGAVFAVRRETVREHGKDVYERALAGFHHNGSSIDPEVGFFMERMWTPIFSKKYWLSLTENP